MKNLIVNIFKTLLFFDLGVVIISLLPVIKNSNPALSRLIYEALVLAVTVIFTVVFTSFIEKKRVKLPVGKKKVRLFFIGLISGAVFPVTCITVAAVTKNFAFAGFNKVSHAYFWILALLFYAISSELLLRGYLFTLYKKYYGFTFATVITCCFYITLNLNLLAKNKRLAVTVILLNLLLCFLLEYTKSVIPTITAHFVYILLSTFSLGSFPLSGDYPTLLKYTLTPKKYLLTAEYPLEGSILLLSLTALIALILVIKKYKPIKQLKRFIAFLKRLPQIIRSRKFERYLKRRKAKSR